MSAASDVLVSELETLVEPQQPALRLRDTIPDALYVEPSSGATSQLIAFEEIDDVEPDPFPEHTARTPVTRRVGPRGRGG